MSQGQIALVNQSAVLTFTPSAAFLPQVDIVFFSLHFGQLLSTKVVLKLNDKLPNYAS